MEYTFKSRGRKKIIIEKKISRETIIEVLMEAVGIHQQNVQDCNYLINYFKGEQDILNRQSIDAGYNEKINNKTVLNFAWSSVRDIVGYTFGTKTQYNATTGSYRKDIEEISRILNYEGNSLADHEANTYASICGFGYLCVLPSRELMSDYMPDIPLVDMSLDPRTTFTVHSARIGNPTTMSVTYYTDEENTYFTCYTDDRIYLITCRGNMALTIGSDVKIVEMVNPVGLNPITMVQNNAFLMGDFEVAISCLNAINQLSSDTLNDVENVIKSLLVVINAELNEETVTKVKKNRILELVGGDQNNKVPDAKFIYQQLDALGIQNIREYLEEAYKQIIGIPDRKTRGGGGGDTGDAVKLRDGWADLEIVARIKEQYFKIAKIKQLAVAVVILKKLNLINKDFKVRYLEIKVPRNKIDNLQTKAQAFSTINGTKTLHPADALEMVDITTDVDAKVDRGIKYWEEQAEKAAELKEKEAEKQMQQQQKNQYNTDLKETNVIKDNIKVEKKATKRERVH
ncbi:MAG: phage portal protein [Cellulosilyticum sp.]|nr:phage portal protein [Cellulosilyticum sp.]